MRLEHGQFQKWVAACFPWSMPAAERMRQVAKKFENHQIDDFGFPKSYHYLLAAPSTPETARQEAVGVDQTTIKIGEDFMQSLETKESINWSDFTKPKNGKNPEGRYVRGVEDRLKGIQNPGEEKGPQKRSGGTP